VFYELIKNNKLGIKMTIKTNISSFLNTLESFFTNEKKITIQSSSEPVFSPSNEAVFNPSNEPLYNPTNEPTYNPYMRAVHPLFGLMKKSQGINEFKRDQGLEPIYEMKAFASTFLEKENTALELAIKSAQALYKMHKGYKIKPLPNGDFIATRNGASAYVRSLPYVESLFYKGAETVSNEDINELAELKDLHNCSAAVYLSFSHSGLEQKFYCKTKDVFGLDGLTLFTLLNDGKYAKHDDYIEQHKATA
jgi:hypothetical protein